MSKKLWRNSKCKLPNLFENDSACNRRLSICWSKIGKSPIFQSLRSSYLANSLWPQLKKLLWAWFYDKFLPFLFQENGAKLPRWQELKLTKGNKWFLPAIVRIKYRKLYRSCHILYTNVLIFFSIFHTSLLNITNWAQMCVQILSTKFNKEPDSFKDMNLHLPFNEL